MTVPAQTRSTRLYTPTGSQNKDVYWFKNEQGGVFSCDGQKSLPIVIKTNANGGPIVIISCGLIQIFVHIFFSS